MVICYDSPRKPRRVLAPGRGAAVTNTENVEDLWNWVRGRGWKNFEMKDRSSLACCEESASKKCEQ